jgi:riboflavin biosynthesis pyrimidine reductase
MTAQIDSLWPVPGTDLDDDTLADALARDDRRQPWVRVNFVSSLDGAATHGGLSGGLSGEADKRVFDVLRRLADVVVVGAGTVRAEGYGPLRLEEPAVRWRRAHGLAEHPVFAIVSGRLALDPASPIFTDAPVRPILVTTGASDRASLQGFAAVADVLVCGEDELDSKTLVAALVERGLPQVHSEGGPTLFGSLLADDAIDELCLTLSPQLESGNARRISHGELAESRGMTLASVLRSDETLMLRYTRER